MLFDNPDFSIIAALLTQVELGVEFRVQDGIVDVMKQSHHSVDVVLHVRHFYVAYCAARRELLELSLFGQFVECVDFFAHIDVVAVGDVVVIGHLLDDAEAVLQVLCELICC